MSHPLRFYAFWSINARVDYTECRAQLKAFRAAGLDGVVWHPRRYSGEPAYLSEAYFALVSGVVLEAKALGLAFWIYDENGWPSGIVDGQMLACNPEMAQQWAGLYPEKPDDMLAEFEREGVTWYLGRKQGTGVDYLNPQLARHFLEMTHERYRHGLASEAWTHVEAVFCDEPELGLGHAYDALPKGGAIPWTPDLPEVFARRYGEPLLPQIGGLFFAGEGAAELRVKFWELLRDRFAEVFLRPIDTWCRANRKKFTAHIKGEEHPLFQVPMVGSCSVIFRELSLPGIDALERFPSNGFYPRQLVTSARQFGDGRSMAEAFGGAGWGATPEDLERYLLWLARCGVTDFVMHLSQYRLDSSGIRDWPPSQPLHLNWRDAYPEVLRRVRHEMQKNPSREADTLVITPHRGIMEAYEPRELAEMNIHNAAIFADTAAGKINERFLRQVEELHVAGVVCDFVDEEIYEAHAMKTEHGVRVGKCEYIHLIVSPSARLKGGPPVVEMTDLRCPGFFDQHGSIDAHASGNVGVRSLLEWHACGARENSILLEVDIGGVFARFSCDREVALARKPDFQVRFADSIGSCCCNGRMLALERDERGDFAVLPRTLLSTVSMLEFSWRGEVASPFVWLEGDFLLESVTGYENGPPGTLRTQGPFVVRNGGASAEREQVVAGWPFAYSSLLAEAAIVLPAGAKAFRFDDIAGDAARVWLGEQELGWTWGPNWEVAVPDQVQIGAHLLRVELVPSTFNYFGPHRYVGGDWHVVSPDQFSGKKNFADPVDAPDSTLGIWWHFKPHQLPGSVIFLNRFSYL